MDVRDKSGKFDITLMILIYYSILAFILLLSYDFMNYELYNSDVFLCFYIKYLLTN